MLYLRIRILCYENMKYKTASVIWMKVKYVAWVKSWELPHERLKTRITSLNYEKQYSFLYRSNIVFFFNKQLFKYKDGS